MADGDGAMRMSRHLTARQVEVLALAVAGMTPYRIAARLDITEPAVRRQYRNIAARLGVSGPTFDRRATGWDAVRPGSGEPTRVPATVETFLERLQRLG